MKKLFAVILLLALAAAPAAHAAETSPWSLTEGTKTRREDLGRIPRFSWQRGTAHVSASQKWLRQARINGYLLNLRLFAPDGSGRMFQEQLEEMDPTTSDLRLYMLSQTDEGGLMLQMDEHALDILKNYGIREIYVADKDFYLQNTYTVEELYALRSALSLEPKQQLCLGGEDDPVMIVSETGKRSYAVQ